MPTIIPPPSEPPDPIYIPINPSTQATSFQELLERLAASRPLTFTGPTYEPEPEYWELDEYVPDPPRSVNGCLAGSRITVDTSENGADVTVTGILVDEYAADQRHLSEPYEWSVEREDERGGGGSPGPNGVPGWLLRSEELASIRPAVYVPRTGDHVTVNLDMDRDWQPGILFADSHATGGWSLSRDDGEPGGGARGPNGLPGWMLNLTEIQSARLVAPVRPLADGDHVRALIGRTDCSGVLHHDARADRSGWSLMRDDGVPGVGPGGGWVLSAREFGSAHRVGEPPTPTPTPAPIREPVEERECTTCYRVLPLTRDYWYHVGGRWSHNCRGCCDERRLARPRSLRGPRRFGVEFEVCGDMRALNYAMNEAGLRCELESYGHAVSSRWKIVSDGSLSGRFPESCGEVVSPPLWGEAGRQAIRLLGEVFAAQHISVSRRCGLHVHHEIADYQAPDFARLFRMYYESQSAIDSVVAPSRRNQNAYCAHLELRMVEVIERMVGRGLSSLREEARHQNRFVVLNPTSYPRYGTVEFRQHHATTNMQDVLDWIDFGQAMITAAKSNTEPVVATALCDLLPALEALPAEVAVRLLARGPNGRSHRRPLSRESRALIQARDSIGRFSSGSLVVA